jgi:hypothetical protein
VQVDLHSEVRGELEPSFLAQRHDPQELGDAADPGSVGLNVVHRAALDEEAMLGSTGEHLAGGDRGVKLVGQHGVALGVVAVQGFLDPRQAVAFELPTDAERGNPIPLLICVDHQGDVVAQLSADRLDPIQVHPGVRLSDLDLDSADSALE